MKVCLIFQSRGIILGGKTSRQMNESLPHESVPYLMKFRKAGVQEGNTVAIGNFELEWQE